jgi:two-component system, OmpR family, phosphate regulon response regulator OmpR
MTQPTKHVLIIDDDEDIHFLVKSSLRHLPLLFTDVFNASSGIEKLEENRYDLIMLDVMMPGGSGADFMKEALTRALNLPPIMMMTSIADFNLIRNVKNLGVAEFIPKPFQPEDIRNVVHKLIFFTPTAASH